MAHPLRSFYAPSILLKLYFFTLRRKCHDLNLAKFFLFNISYQIDLDFVDKDMTIR